MLLLKHEEDRDAADGGGDRRKPMGNRGTVEVGPWSMHAGADHLAKKTNKKEMYVNGNGSRKEWKVESVVER